MTNHESFPIVNLAAATRWASVTSSKALTIALLAVLAGRVIVFKDAVTVTLKLLLL